MPEDEGGRVVRMVLHHLVPGDLRKFQAESNDSDSGGGARDLRFRPETVALRFFRQMFPQRREEVTRDREGNARQVEVAFGPIRWANGPGGVWQEGMLDAWPRTPSRNEARLARVNEFGFDALFPITAPGDKAVLILTQTADGSVFVTFTTGSEIRADQEGDPVLRDFAIDWLRGNKKSGYIDLLNNERHPNARRR